MTRYRQYALVKTQEMVFEPFLLHLVASFGMAPLNAAMFKKVRSFL